MRPHAKRRSAYHVECLESFQLFAKACILLQQQGRFPIRIFIDDSLSRQTMSNSGVLLVEATPRSQYPLKAVCI